MDSQPEKENQASLVIENDSPGNNPDGYIDY